MNQVSQSTQLTAFGHGKLDCTPGRHSLIEMLELEVEAMRATALHVQQQNEELKQQIHSIFINPNQKRILLQQIEEKHKISRRRACRLLTLARSTCWYRPSLEPAFSVRQDEPISTLTQPALILRLKKLCRQAEYGYGCDEAELQPQWEYGLNRLGLPRAAQISKTHLKLAMDIFTAWCQQNSK